MTKSFTGSCQWVDYDLEVQWVELKQILHLKVGCSDFGTGAVYPNPRLYNPKALTYQVQVDR